MQTEYDISRAFKRIENDLIDSMIKNLKRHKAEELKEGFDWEQWQAIQLRELELYRRRNRAKFNVEFDEINKRIEDLYRMTAKDSQTKQEAELLKKALDGDISHPVGEDVAFFGVNDGRLNALIEATKADFDKAEQSVLRKSEDIYRQVIFDAQVNSAAGATYEQAVDMATKDFLKRGIQSIVYKNGSRHNISEYARMALKTGQKRAYLMGEGNANAKFGIHTVRVNKRTHACPKCVRFLGRVLIDDVYSGGTEKEARDMNIPTLSQAMRAGFLHPNCKDIYSLFIPGVSKPAKAWTEPEIEQIVDEYNDEQELNNAENTLESYKRLAAYSLFPGNQQFYSDKASQWEDKVDVLKEKEAAAKLEELSTYFSEKFNIVIPDEVKALDKQAITEGLSGIKDGLDILESWVPGSIKNQKIELAVGDMGFMQVTEGKDKSLIININPAYYNNNKETQQFIQDSIETGDFLPGTTLRTIGTHEIGHVEEFMMAMKSDKKFPDWYNLSYKASNHASGVFEEAVANRDAIIKDLVAKGELLPSDVDAFTAKYMKSSRYAKGYFGGYTENEFVAEAFHDVVQLGKENASPINKDIVRIMEKNYKKAMGVSEESSVLQTYHGGFRGTFEPYMSVLNNTSLKSISFNLGEITKKNLIPTPSVKITKDFIQRQPMTVDDLIPLPRAETSEVFGSKEYTNLAEDTLKGLKDKRIHLDLWKEVAPHMSEEDITNYIKNNLNTVSGIDTKATAFQDRKFKGYDLLGAKRLSYSGNDDLYQLLFSDSNQNIYTIFDVLNSGNKLTLSDDISEVLLSIINNSSGAGPDFLDKVSKQLRVDWKKETLKQIHGGDYKLNKIDISTIPKFEGLKYEGYVSSELLYTANSSLLFYSDKNGSIYSLVSPMHVGVFDASLGNIEYSYRVDFTKLDTSKLLKEVNAISSDVKDTLSETSYANLGLRRGDDWIDAMKEFHTRVEADKPITLVSREIYDSIETPELYRGIAEKSRLRGDIEKSITAKDCAIQLAEGDVGNCFPSRGIYGDCVAYTSTSTSIATNYMNGDGVIVRMKLKPDARIIYHDDAQRLYGALKNNDYVFFSDGSVQDNLTDDQELGKAMNMLGFDAIIEPNGDNTGVPFYMILNRNALISVIDDYLLTK